MRVISFMGEIHQEKALDLFTSSFLRIRPFLHPSSHSKGWGGQEERGGRMTLGCYS